MNTPNIVLWVVFLASTSGFVLLVATWGVLGVRQRRADPAPRTRLSNAEASADTQPIPIVGYNPARQALRRLREADHDLSAILVRQLIDRSDSYTAQQVTAAVETSITEPAHDDEHEHLDDAPFQDLYSELLQPWEWRHADRHRPEPSHNEEGTVHDQHRRSDWNRDTHWQRDPHSAPSW